MHSILRRLFGYAKHKARTVASSGLVRLGCGLTCAQAAHPCRCHAPLPPPCRHLRKYFAAALGYVHFALQGLIHGDAVAGLGQRVAQGAEHSFPIQQGIAQREQQAAEQGFQLCQFAFIKTQGTPEGEVAQVLAVMAETIGCRMWRTLAQLNTQVIVAVLIAECVQGHQALYLLEEQAQDALGFQAGLQLHVQLPTQFAQGHRFGRGATLAGKAQALELGGIEVDGVATGGRRHGR